KGVPANAATSAAFKDSDLAGRKIGGEISVSRALNESDITEYVLYFGSSATTKETNTPFAILPKTVQNLKFKLPSGTPKSPNASHILVYTRNADGEMATGLSVPIVDLGIPENAAVSVSFKDENINGGKLDGTISIARAVKETDLTDYVVYFGTDTAIKASMTPIATVATTGSNLNIPLPPGTIKPTNATHILVYSKNADGEMANGISVPLYDVGIPVNSATSVSFTDTDLRGGKIGGDIAIAKAANESDISDYVIYFGSNASTKLSGQIVAEIAKTDANLKITLPDGTDKPKDATHFLVFTRNKDGEMATARSVLIVDKGVPYNAAAGVSFTDDDIVGGKIGGNIVIKKAANESDVSHYVVYFGSSASTKAASTSIGRIERTGSDLVVKLPSGTDKPSNATHLLVYTMNNDGEMASPVSSQIADKGVPLNPAAGVSFKDTDINGNKIAGEVVISKAADESDITNYALYFGSDTKTKIGTTEIIKLKATGANITFNLSAEGIIKPPTASYFLVFTENPYGQMPTGVAVKIEDEAPAQITSSSGGFTCALMINKTVRCWGNNEGGQLGNGTVLSRSTPTPVAGLNDVKSLFVNGSSVCALKEDKTVSCWGYNFSGQLGDGTTLQRSLPTKVVGLDSVIALAGGDSHTCALLENKTVKCWGGNYRGQLGDGTFTNRPLPTEVLGLSGVESISSSCALMTDKTVKCWGTWAGDGASYDGSTAPKTSTPTKVSGLSNVISISQNALNTCVLLADRSVKCWGDNIMGQLGDNSQVSKNVPTPVSNLSGVLSIYLNTHLCALLADKTVKCWGTNFYGEIDNTKEHKLIPVMIPNLSNVISLSVSEFHTCALLADKNVKCWGANSTLLGDGNSLDNSTVIKGLSGVLSVSNGLYHTCALLENQSVKCWGQNSTGPLGDGTLIDSVIPKTVSPSVSVKSDPGATPMTFDEANSYCKSCHPFAKSPALWKEQKVNSVKALGDGTMPPRNLPGLFPGRIPALTAGDRQRLIDFITGL
ncbi:MAG: hypothetical protein EBR09_16200, partial [Proteobacteria bacterium]|nr:hypothetical protein [Pseudomonadota bacterium]